MESHLRNLWAAVVTPRTHEDRVDQVALHRLLRQLLDRGIGGFALNGATGEFCRSTAVDVEAILEVAADAIGEAGVFVTGIGSGDERSTVQLGQLAQKAGAEAVLLPMPYFFPYSQPDLTATCEAVAAALDVPVLLYNLPQFSTGLQPETTLDLIRRCPTIVGIKDSSGSLDILRLLAETDVPARKIVGNDTVIRAALLEGVCDGAISGVACVLPELLARIFEVSAATSSPSEEFDRLCATLDLFIAQLDRLPTPWGLKVLAEVRGFGPPNFPLTLAGSRQEEVSALRNWFENHQTELLVR